VSRSVLLACLLAASTARSEEGFWPLNRFPSDGVAQRYGFRPDESWLKHVRNASVRLGQDCSASFVSEQGLLLTNHHCVHACIQGLSSAREDLVKDGFIAGSLADERRCPALEADQLIDIQDVTSRIRAATAGFARQALNRALQAESAKIEGSCQTTEDLRCEVVSLYHGARFDLYKYSRFQDVRLVFAPESAIGFFGGDLDNYMFPRHDLDIAILRVYRHGKPFPAQDHFRVSVGGPKVGELVFASGHPGETLRQATVAELSYQRNISLVDELVVLAEVRGLITEYQRRGAEQRRHSEAMLFGVENMFKALRGRLEALQDERFFEGKVYAEEKLKAALTGKKASSGAYLRAFDAIASTQVELAAIRKALDYFEYGDGFRG
jgi:hypothetical protein